jgi:hypothetical protein
MRHIDAEKAEGVWQQWATRILLERMQLAFGRWRAAEEAGDAAQQEAERRVAWWLADAIDERFKAAGATVEIDVSGQKQKKSPSTAAEAGDASVPAAANGTKSAGPATAMGAATGGVAATAAAKILSAAHGAPSLEGMLAEMGFGPEIVSIAPDAELALRPIPPQSPLGANGQPRFMFLETAAPSGVRWDVGQAGTSFLRDGASHPAVMAARWGGKGAIEFVMRELGSPATVSFDGAAHCPVSLLAARGDGQGALAAIMERARDEAERDGLALSWIAGCLDWASEHWGSERDETPRTPESVRSRVREASPWVKLREGKKRLGTAPTGAFFQTIEHALCSFSWRGEAPAMTKEEKAGRAELAAATLRALLEIAPADHWPLSFTDEREDDGSPPDPDEEPFPYGVWDPQSSASVRCDCEGDPFRRLVAMSLFLGAWWAVEALLEDGFPTLSPEEIDAINWPLAGLCRDEEASSIGRWLYDAARARAILDKAAITGQGGRGLGVLAAATAVDAAPARASQRI